MILSWQPSKGFFVLRVSRSDGVDVAKMMDEHGLDLSETKSTNDEAYLYTAEPYAALTFFDHGTPEAKEQLAHLKEQVDASKSKSSDKVFRSPPGMELWPFQRAGVAYALERQHSLIGDQPGLGKTPQAIVYANEIDASRVLVICPANIRLQWARMIRAWSTMKGNYHVYPILKSADGVNPHAAWTVISYDLARTPAIYSALYRRDFDLLIIDEAHYLKTPDTERTRHVFGGEHIVGTKDERHREHVAGLAERSKRVLALTGTPLPNRPRECYTLAKGLCFDAIDWMSERAFRHRFNPSMQFNNGGVREEVGRLPELQNRLRANFMVRRLKREVLTQLPPIMHEIVPMSGSDADKRSAIKAALRAESLLQIDPTDLSGHDAMVLGHISTVRKQMGIALAPEAAGYTEMLVEGGIEKIFLVAHHIEVLNILEKRLSHFGLVRVDGSTSPGRRQAAVDKFQKDPRTRIFLGGLTAIGIGVDGLQKVCSRAVLAECSWVPGDNDQVISRLERMGQTDAVQADFIVAPGSFSERVLSMALAKMRDTHAALDKDHG